MSELVKADGAGRLFCSFRTEGRLYGIDAAQVREISAQVAISPVPHAPPAVRGLANLRSRIYLVVDIRPLLGLAPAPSTDDSRLIVLRPHLAENMGVFVEHSGDIIRVSAARIEDASLPAVETCASPAEQPSAVTVGVCKLEGELMNIVDAARLVEAVETAMR
jgi:purine-binding chemotaxis protein CheW